MKRFAKQSDCRTIQSFSNSSTTKNKISNNPLASHETTVSQSYLTVQIDSTFPRSQQQEQISSHPSESSQLLSPSRFLSSSNVQQKETQDVSSSSDISTS